MSIVRIATHFNIDIEFTAPPFYRRLAAWVIDIVIQIVYLIVALRMLNWLTLAMPGNDSNMKIWALSLLLFLPLALYHVILEITMQGQSIGKKLLGIKVVSENGGRPSIGQFIIRWLMRTMDISVIMMIMMIPYAQMFGPQVYWGMA
ncbi:MAG: RDD family protein, partial [Chitinophagaceae bacterium]